MKNRLVNIFVFLGLNTAVAVVTVALAVYLYSEGLGGGYTLMFFILIMLSLFPVLYYFQNRVDLAMRPISQDDLYVQTVDSILNIEYFDEMLKVTFDKILRLMSAKGGQLVFYRQEKDEFEVYYQKNRKKDEESLPKIESDNVLLNRMHGPDDIIIKGKLDPINKRNWIVFDEFERLGSEIAVPIYYQNIRLGLILIGGRRRFSEDEIRLLKIFASKIAILVQNSFYFSKILKKKELEKEYELISKIQRQFLPGSNYRKGNVNIEVYHQAESSMTREFYDIFSDNHDVNEIRISAYRIFGDIKETSILMPGIKASLQCFTRLGFSPKETISTIDKISKEKDDLIGDLSILHASINQSGTFVCSNNNYTTPLIYKKLSRSLSLIHNGQNEEDLQIGVGDIIIIACKALSDVMAGNIDKYTDIIEDSYSSPLNEMKIILRDKIIADSGNNQAVEIVDDAEDLIDEEDKLLILIKLEEQT